MRLDGTCPFCGEKLEVDILMEKHYSPVPPAPGLWGYEEYPDRVRFKAGDKVKLKVKRAGFLSPYNILEIEGRCPKCGIGFKLEVLAKKRYRVIPLFPSGSFTVLKDVSFEVKKLRRR